LIGLEVFVQTSHMRWRQTDKQTDRQTEIVIA